MRRLLFGICAAAAAFCGATTATANQALLIANSNYAHGDRLPGTRAVIGPGRLLENVGFAVAGGVDLDADETREALSRLLDADNDGAILISLSGYFVTGDDGELWFLGVDADRPNRATVGAQGVALSTVYAIAAEAPGRAIVLLSTVRGSLNVGTGLRRGNTQLPEPPQGVTVVSGAPDAMARLTGQILTREGITIQEALRQLGSNVNANGFISDVVPFVDAASGPAVVNPTPTPTTDARDEADLWEAVRELNSEGAYISYLSRYPTGRFAAEAQAALDELRDPVRVAAAEESALALSRNDRRQIQSDLTVLGFDTNGIDGIFGNGTRSAIRAWQASVGFAQTGHVTETSLRRLSRLADARRDEIAAEEAVRQAERERLDRAYWTATGRGQDEPGLRAYLNRYPEGLFADVATDRLAEIDGARAAEAEAEEDAAWSFATRQDSVRAYRGYLALYPEGDHAREARNRIAELRGEPQPFPEVNVAELEAREAALNLPGITRMLIERRLSDQGYRPGTADGRFDSQTREAIRAFQAANGLDATGYLDQRTVARFLSDGFQVIIR